MDYLVAWLTGVYIFLSLVGLIGGIAGSDLRYSGCATHNRLEKLFPSYRLGCWLGETLDK